MAYAVQKQLTGYIVDGNKRTFVVFNKYTVDTFDDLPFDNVKIGDTAVYNDNGYTREAHFVSVGWISEGKILPVPTPSDDTIYEIAIPETTIELGYNGETEGWIMGSTTLETSPQLVAGQTCRLTIDDREPIEITLTDVEGVLAAGNYLVHLGEGDSGEDYMIVFIVADTMTVNFGLQTDVEGSHTIKLECM